MALQKTEGNKKKKLQLTLLLIAIAAVFYFGFFAGDGGQEEGIVARRSVDIPEVNFNIVDKGIIDLFISWSSIPLEVGETGKNNPFSRENPPQLELQ